MNLPDKISTNSTNKSSPNTVSPAPQLKAQFTGIWDRDNKQANITNKAETLVEQRLTTNMSTKKKKSWGIKSVFLNTLLFIASQFVVGILAILISISNANGNIENGIGNILSNPWILLLSNGSMYVIWILGMLYVTYTKGQRSLKKDFGVFFRWYDPLIGLALAAALFGLVALSSWIFGDVFKLNMQGSDNGSLIESYKGIWFWVIAMGMASLAGPLFEELFFRGFVLRAILKSIKNHLYHIKSEDETGFSLKLARGLHRYRNWIAIIISSVFFGIMHFQGASTFGQWYVVGATGTLGLIFGICAVKFKRIGPTIIAHMAYNAVTLLLATM